jgi:AcrR family transcriptional regulator
MEYSPRQIEIIIAASELIGEKGIQNLTTKNLAAKMNFSEPALYRHFKDKTEILLSLLTYYIEEMKLELTTVLKSDLTGEQMIKGVMEFQFSHFSKNPAIVMVIFAETSFQYNQLLSEKVVSILQQKKKLLTKIIQTGQKDTSIRKDIAPSQMADIIMGSMRFTILRWRLTNFDFNLVDEGKLLWKTMAKLLKEN